MSFAEAATTTEGATFSSITEMIKKLTQPEGAEALKVSTEEVSLSTIVVTEESSQPGDLSGDLPSLTP